MVVLLSNQNELFSDWGHKSEVLLEVPELKNKVFKISFGLSKMKQLLDLLCLGKNIHICTDCCPVVALQACKQVEKIWAGHVFHQNHTQYCRHRRVEALARLSL